MIVYELCDGLLPYTSREDVCNCIGVCTWECWVNWEPTGIEDCDNCNNVEFRCCKDWNCTCGGHLGRREVE